MATGVVLESLVLSNAHPMTAKDVDMNTLRRTNNDYIIQKLSTDEYSPIVLVQNTPEHDQELAAIHRCAQLTVRIEKLTPVLLISVLIALNCVIVYPVYTAWNTLLILLGMTLLTTSCYERLHRRTLRKTQRLLNTNVDVWLFDTSSLAEVDAIAGIENPQHVHNEHIDRLFQSPQTLLTHARPEERLDYL